jgi:hypothetical protein
MSYEWAFFFVEVIIYMYTFNVIFRLSIELPSVGPALHKPAYSYTKRKKQLTKCIVE